MPAGLSRAEAEAFLKALLALHKARALYPPGHSMVLRAADALEHLARQILDAGEPLLLGVADGYLVAGGVAFLGDNPQARELAQRLQARELEGVLFAPEARASDLGAFLDWLRANGSEPWQNPRVTLTRLSREGEGWARGRRLHGDAVAAVVEACRNVEEGRIPDPTRAQECVAGFSRLLGENPTLVRGLTLLKDYDQYTYYHSVNVCLLTLGVGRQLGLRAEDLESVGVGGLFHDIGKTRTPVEVIRKPGRLSINEVSLVRWHPVYGRDILEQMAGLPPQVPRLVYEHHMRFDGGGYPSRGEGERLHPLSQLVCVADVYDAMTTHRPYSAPLPLPAAVKAMAAASGTHFAPPVLEAMLSILGPVPVGSLVRLATGEVAWVTRLSEEGQVAQVRLAATAEGEVLEGDRRAVRPVTPADVAGWVSSLTPARLDAFEAVSAQTS